MLETVLAAYGIAFESCRVETLVSGLINKTWKITTEKNAYILQRINDAVFKDPLAIATNLRRLDNHLKLKHPDYIFVAPLKTNSGDEMARDANGGYYRLFPFITGSHTISVVSTPHQAYEAAFQFGLLTRLLSGYDAGQLINTIPDFHNLSMRYAMFQKACATGNSDRIVNSAALIRQVESYGSIVTAFEELKRNPGVHLRVMHHDTKISNVLFDAKGSGIAVIDLDTVMPGYFISDFGDMMRTYLSPANEEERDLSKIAIREDFFEALVRGYLQSTENELTDEERKLMVYSGSFLTYMQAIRFLTDHLNNDVYYGAAYAGHNWQRAANQLALLDRLHEKQAVLHNIVIDMKV